MADVFEVTVADEETGCRPGDLVAIDEADPDIPYAIVRPLNLGELAHVVSVGGLTPRPDLAGASYPCLPSSVPAPGQRHLRRLK